MVCGPGDGPGSPTLVVCGDSRLLLVASALEVRVLALPSLRQLCLLDVRPPPDAGFLCAAVSPDRRCVVTALSDGSVVAFSVDLTPDAAWEAAQAEDAADDA